MPASDSAGSPSLFHVTYTPGNGYRWFGSGDISIDNTIVSFSAQQRRPFWFSKSVHRDFLLANVVNVERFDAMVRLEITDSEGSVRKLQFQAINSICRLNHGIT